MVVKIVRWLTFLRRGTLLGGSPTSLEVVMAASNPLGGRAAGHEDLVLEDGAEDAVLVGERLLHGAPNAGDGLELRALELRDLRERVRGSENYGNDFFCCAVGGGPKGWGRSG